MPVRFFGSLALGVGLGFSILYSPAECTAADPAATPSIATNLLSDALQAEMDGDLLMRERLLTEAEQVEPDRSLAPWFRGRLLNREGHWRTVDEMIDDARSDSLLSEYEAFRSTLPATVDGNWRAARWCASNGLAQQCRAHLMNILVMDPEHSVARGLLGHQLIGGEWVTPEQRLKMQQKVAFTQQSFAKYLRSVEGLVEQAKVPSSKKSAESLAKLDAIVDPLAIPVMEAVAERHGATVALWVAGWLGKIEHQESAAALARMATYYPNAAVQNKAIDELKSKSLFDFVPDMLAAMSSPIVFSSIPVFDINGHLTGFRQAFGKESMNDIRLFQVDTGVNVLRLPPLPEGKQTEISGNTVLLSRDESKPFGSRNEWLTEKTTTEYELAVNEGENALIEAVTKAAANATMYARVASAAAENQVIQERNARIANVIAEVVGTEFSSIPSDVWKWWDNYNETDYQRSKLPRRRRQSLGFVANQYFDYTASTSREYSITYGSCFVAGTPVNTSRGLRAIETLQPGDMVLSRDVRTGELCYRPVVTATTRAPAKTVVLQVNDEKIHATTSHLLWVSGKGWVKAGDIQPGALLHSAAEPGVVMSVTPDAVLPTHNLIVADTHAYFVGKNRVLSHDVLPRISVQELVPGHFLLAENK